MEGEKSCGALVYRKDRSGFSFLLLKHFEIHGGHWDFPKGKIEQGETEQETTTREIREETGFTVKLRDGWRREVEYASKEGTMKTVVFFLAEPLTGELKWEKGKTEELRWMEFDKALNLLPYDNMKELLRDADRFLNKSE